MKLSKDNTINLEDFRAKDGHKISKVFTGRDRGLYVREQSKIDEIEQSYDEVKIIIPNNIYSINPSFFEELFVNIIKRLGKENFMKKIHFTSEGDYNYETPLNEAIERVLRKNSALQK